MCPADADKSSLAGVRLLLIEDEEDFVRALAERLRLRGLDVTESLSADEALRHMEEGDFDVVLLDIRMPGVDGIDALRTMKQLKPLVEVILLTGYATVETAVEGMKLGAFDYMIKPADTQELLRKIQEAFSRKATHDERIRKAEIDRIVKRRGW